MSTHDGSTHCSLCSEPLRANENGLCERHLTEPMDERWADVPKQATQTKQAGDRDPMSPASRALLVLVLTDHVRAYLMDRDPKALAQAVGALLYEPNPELSADAIRILTLTDDLLVAKGARASGSLGGAGSVGLVK